MRERWFGATGRRVAEIVLEGDPAVPLGEALVLESVDEVECWRRRTALERRSSCAAGMPRRSLRALARPEVSCAVVPAGRTDLLELDLRRMTYG